MHKSRFQINHKSQISSSSWHDHDRTENANRVGKAVLGLAACRFRNLREKQVQRKASLPASPVVSASSLAQGQLTTAWSPCCQSLVSIAYMHITLRCRALHTHIQFKTFRLENCLANPSPGTQYSPIHVLKWDKKSEGFSPGFIPTLRNSGPIAARCNQPTKPFFAQTFGKHPKHA